MGRLIILAIDGMDRDLISRFGKSLPTLEGIDSMSPKISLESVFPPDSETAWASVYTGLDPAKHGVVHFLDPLEKSLLYQSKDSDSENFRGNTFWDIAGKDGIKVCILLPHIGYPIWHVNGVMIGRSSIRNDVQIYPPDKWNDFDYNNLNTIKGFPGRGGLSHQEFVRRHEILLESTAELSNRAMNEQWDLIFVYSSILDVVPHFFWKFFDRTDPYYRPGNSYENIIKHFYELHDHFIGNIFSQMNKDDILMILSDHGHGRRPIKNININQLLHLKGCINLKQDNSAASPMKEYVRREMLKLAAKYNLENFGAKFLKHIPSLRESYLKSSTIDWRNTIACTSDLSGIKSYSYGGIRINRKLIGDENVYNKLLDEIIKMLLDIQEPHTNRKIVNWAIRREELYTGPYIDRYPDIVLELLEDYGIGNRVKAPIIEDSNSHGIVPGSHRRYSPVFYMIGQGLEVNRRKMSLVDVSPTIMDILGIPIYGHDFDGESILRRSDNIAI